jgi:hypothetical protein
MTQGRAKCDVLEGFGRALHGAQDFYAHSNWTDLPAPRRPLGLLNPPGLGLSAPSPILALRGAPTLAVPRDLSTGCFTTPGSGSCTGRVTHKTLNKDTGTINPRTGAATAPTTDRGKVLGNFARAVRGAIIETQRQWADFRAELVKTYGEKRGNRMICALTHDNAAKDCGITMYPTSFSVIWVDHATARLAWQYNGDGVWLTARAYSTAHDGRVWWRREQRLTPDTVTYFFQGLPETPSDSAAAIEACFDVVAHYAPDGDWNAGEICPARP